MRTALLPHIVGTYILYTMKMCYKLFFFVIFTVVGTVSVLGEPCSEGQGSTNMKACLLCATNGKGKGQCCNDIYYNSNDRDDDFLRGDINQAMVAV